MKNERPLIATYRLQLHAGFGFAHAMERVPYLKKLGISHLYLSPVLQAAKGSRHGYDLVDPTKLSDDLGGRQGFEQLARTASSHGLGLILDIVPNHMCISDPANLWWWDVLENGPSARWAHAFDIDWDAREPSLKDRVLLPVLGDHRHRVLQRREVKLARDGVAFTVRYYDHRFPLSHASIASLLRQAGHKSGNARALFLADAYQRLDQPGVTRALLSELLQDAPACAAALDASLDEVNQNPDALDALLDQQHYRLAWWRTADRDLDYRRFFDVNSLIAMRTEDERVFEASHALVRELSQQGLIDGVRVDHVDGLCDPATYLERLSAFVGRIWVEKIVASEEELRRWPVQGATGYQFATDVTALFVDPAAEGPLTDVQRELAGEARPFAEISAEARLQVLDELLGSDVNRLTATLLELRERHRDMRDFSRHELKTALRALVAAFPAYRSYLQPGKAPDPFDAALVDRAVQDAHALQPGLDRALLDFLADVLLGRRTGELEGRLVERFQQLTAPAMAKGVEDTALYRDVRLLALNEVGTNPGRFSLSVAGFHARQARVQQMWPNRLMALSTHDTKRSADVRARLVAMSQDPASYAALARDFIGATGDAVDGRMRLFALQTLIGAWPLDFERLHGTLLKSAREAKLFTRWTKNDAKYEQALEQLSRSVLDHAGLRSAVERCVARLDVTARSISLAMTLLQCTCPGVPDIYQGQELWRFDLVDPDNRRPVDWAKRDAAMEERTLPSLETDAVGLNRLHVIRRALSLRRERPDLFHSYEPLVLAGPAKDHALAFARGGGVVSVVALRPQAEWAETSVELPAGDFEPVLVGGARHSGRVRLAALFDVLPVALLRAV